MYNAKGELILRKGEKIISSFDGSCGRGWKRQKVGWRPIFFDGEGFYYVTNLRIVFLRVPKFYNQIDVHWRHQISDFGEWEYHARRSNRARELGALEFFEFLHTEIEQLKPLPPLTTIFIR